MNRAARTVLRKIGEDQAIDSDRHEEIEAEFKANAQAAGSAENPEAAAQEMRAVPDEMLTETEKRHEHYRRRQSMAGRFTPAAERLPIMSSEERQQRDSTRPKYHATEFEGTLEKLIEKYENLEVVQRHLTLGQAMKYEFTSDGKILDRDGNLVYDGERLVDPPK